MAVRIAAQAELIPGYRLIERIGRGGFGEVWKAEAPGGMLKAIKFVYGNLDEATENGKPAEQELKALNRVKTIRHPYILSLERFDIVDGQLCIVMELADRNLFDRFRECQTAGLAGIPREELLSYLQESAEALDLMNNHYQIQHLDIKPQNLFLVFNHIKVADFGLAKDMEGVQATLTGGVTPVYAAPETFEGHVSRFCDQYSLAIVFQEMLTGSRPFPGTTARQLMMQHLQVAPDVSVLPPSDRAVVKRALAKVPEERFATCADFIKALRRPATDEMAAGVLIAATPPPATTPNLLQPAMSAALLSPAVSPGDRDPLTPDRRGVYLAGIREGARLPALEFIPRTAAQRTVAAPVPEPPEQTGPGPLVPALVIGLGQTGLLVLQRLRRAIRDRFGTPILPNIRMLYVDTDPETIQAVDAGSSIALAPNEVFLAKLNRPSHYTRPANEQLGIDRWLNPNMLFRIPRNPLTNGIRAFGRLAFCDHYRALMSRIRSQLDGCVSSESLAEAERITGFSLRTNRPRVYIVSSLVGGTGAGMFIDAAYAVRHQLKQIGYRVPDVRAILLAPRIDPGSSKNQTVANAYAALIELAHYSSPKSQYEALFDSREGPIVDRDRPFRNCMLLQMPKSTEASGLKSIVNQSAGSLIRDLLTPLGRGTDRVREESSDSFVRTFGSFRLTWPRLALMERTASRVCARLLELWSTRDSSHLSTPIRAWLDEQWARRQLSPELLLVRLRETCQTALQFESERQFDSIIDRLNEQSGNAGPGAIELYSGLEQLIDLIGRPEIEGRDSHGGTLMELLDRTAVAMASEVEAKLAEMAVSFVDLPAYRLPGAEEAIRQLSTRLRQTLDEYELLEPGLESASNQLYSRVLNQIATMEGMSRGSRKAALAHTVLADIRQFARKRFEALLNKTLVSLYRGMINYAPEHLHDLQFCRGRLEAVQAQFVPAIGSDIETYLGPGKPVLPPGCRSVDAAADQIAAGLTVEDLVEIDTCIQVHVRKHFKTLVSFCLDKNDRTVLLAEIVGEQVREFLKPRFQECDSASIFFQSQTAEQAAHRDVMQAFDEALPDMTATPPKPGKQFLVLAVPDNPSGTKFASLAEQTLADTKVTVVSGGDDIVLYRESGFTAAELPQLSAAAREAFVQISHADQASPHARSDVKWTTG